jgi:signal transduction histidine kinase
MIWASRTFGYVWVGLIVFVVLRHPHGVSALPWQIGAYVLIGLALGVWAAMDVRTPVGAPLGPRLPVTLGVMAAASGVISTARDSGLLVLFACIAALAAASDTGLGSAFGVAGVGILGVLLGSVAFGNANTAILVGFPLTILGALLLGRHRRTYRVQAEQAVELLAQSRELQVQQRRADVLEERTRIAREIHDVLAHSLGGLGIQIQAARAVLTDQHDVDKALDVLATAQRMAAGGLVETRRAVHALRSDTLSLDEELAALANVHDGRYRASVDFAVNGQPRELPPAATMAMIRVAQESLANAAKHAPHQPIDLRMEYTAKLVRLTIANPLGHGDTSSEWDLRTADGGYGLTGMQERLLLLGGTLTAGRCGGTWTVAAELPHTPAATSATEEGRPVDW